MITLEEQQRLSEREIRVNKLTPELAELRKNAIILSELKVNIPRPYVGVTDFEHIPPAIGAPESPKLDPLFVSNSCISKDSIGEFCGSPIHTMDALKAEVDVVVDRSRRIKNSSNESVPAELLPGEKICEDNVIRHVNVSTEVLQEHRSIGKKMYLLKKNDQYAVSVVFLKRGYYGPRTLTGGVSTAFLHNKETGVWEETAVKLYADNFVYLKEKETHPEEVFTTHVDRIAYKEFVTQKEAEDYMEEEAKKAK